MSKEAMKLALEALEYLCKPILHGWEAETQKEKRDKAITALRKALAEQPAQQETIKQGWDVDTLLDKPKQPAQDVPEVGFGNTALDKMAENARELGLDYEPAQQDIPKIGCVNHDCEKCKKQQQGPVAWMYQCSADSSGPVLMQHKKDWAESGSGLWTETPLYTSPPAQRTWVGLTNDEVNNLAAGCHLGNSVQDAIYKAVAKLKEKNT